MSAKALPGAGHMSLAAFKSDVDLGDHVFVHPSVSGPPPRHPWNRSLQSGRTRMPDAGEEADA